MLTMVHYVLIAMCLCPSVSRLKHNMLGIFSLLHPRSLLWSGFYGSGQQFIPVSCICNILVPLVTTQSFYLNHLVLITISQIKIQFNA